MAILLEYWDSAGKILRMPLAVQHEAHFVPRYPEAKMPPQLEERDYIVGAKIIILHLDS